MRSGDTFVINLDKISPDFKNVYNDQGNFPSYKIFDWSEWRDHDTYMKIVRPEEDHDLLNNKKCFVMNAEFQIAILATYTTNEEILNLCSRIPHSDEFVRLWVLPSEESKPSADKDKEEFKINVHSGTDAYMDGEIQRDKEFIKKYDARKENNGFN